jgi:enoyl-CoA hydratase
MNDNSVTEPEILSERRGALGIITMNRPRALNALTLGMIEEMDRLLGDWANDPSVAAVVLQGAGEKAYCAGGDVRAVWRAGKEGEALTHDFFHEEYSLNHDLHHFAKPIVAMIDGITMGGGVGVSIHCSHRVASERTLFAMPETAIGFFPDVGGSYFLPRFPGLTGLYLAMTGERLKAADCCFVGVANHHVGALGKAEVLAALEKADLSGDAQAGVTAALAALETSPGEPPLAALAADIDRLFAAPSVKEILAGLEAEGSDWARETLDTLRKRSPFSVMLTFELYHRGAALSFDDCMTMEFRISQSLMKGGDFYEGIRAVLVDKDHAPQWSPASIEEVDPAKVEACFASLGERDLTF